MNRIGRDGIFRGDDSRCYTSSGGGGGINYQSLAVEALTDINRSLRTVCALLENLQINLSVGIERRDVLAKAGMVDSSSVKAPVQAVQKETTRGDDVPLISGKVNDNSD